MRTEHVNPYALLRSRQAEFRRDQQLTPGAIIAEFRSAEDAVAFQRIKGADKFVISPGISHMWAVRKMVPV